MASWDIEKVTNWTEALEWSRGYSAGLISSRFTGRMEPMVGIEPTTYCLQNSCSTTELHRRGGQRRVRTFEGVKPRRLQRRAFDHFAICPTIFSGVKDYRR